MPMTAQERRELAGQGDGGGGGQGISRGSVVVGGVVHHNHVRSNNAAMKLRYTKLPNTPSSLRSSLAVASQCKVEGEGLAKAMVRQLATCTITAFDAAGEPISQGGDVFRVEMRGSGNLRARVNDNEDGTYSVSYFPNTSGKYSMSISLNGIALPSSPFELKVMAARPDPANCVLKGDALNAATAREPAAFEVSFIDSLGQHTHAEDLDVFVELLAKVDDGLDPLEKMTNSVTAAEERERRRAERRTQAEQLARDEVAAQSAPASLTSPTERATSPKPGDSVSKTAENRRTQRGESNGAGEAAGKEAGKEASKDPDRVAERRESVRTKAPSSSERRDDLKNTPLDEDSEPDDDADAPPAEILRSIAGPKPLIVRAECDLESEQVGVLAVGGIVRVVAAQPTAQGTRAKVELDMADETSSGFLSFRYGYGSPRSAGAHDNVSWRVPGLTHDIMLGTPNSAPASPIDDFSVAVTSGNGSPRPLRQRMKCFRPDKTHREAWGVPEQTGADADADEPMSIYARLMSPTRQPLAGAAVNAAEVPRYGWVTAAKPGVTFLAPVHEQLDAGERQRHLTLWARRKSIDSLSKSKDVKNGAKEPDQLEPSQSHELANDKAGFAFAFGGVEPGVLHARGQIVKQHTVRYSVGLSGRYRLHVGLRQQGVALPGSPFLLVVSPGPAHASSTHIQAKDLPLTGRVGLEDETGCTIRIQTSDRMGNFCTSGGAAVQAALAVDKHHHKEWKGAEEDLQINVTDHQDGSYTLSWRSERSGVYPVRVMIGQLHISGSPTTLTVVAGVPDVLQCHADGDGLKAARAGLPALIQVVCKDRYGNVAERSDKMKFGLVLIPQGKEAEMDKKDRTASKGDQSKDAARDAAASIHNFTSMAFEGKWEAAAQGHPERYEIAYMAQEAGDFFLHLWMDPDGSGVRKPMVGSPFPVRVSGVRASPGGSFLGGVETYKEEGAESDAPAKLAAGERLVLRPQLRDEFGNASYAPDGALTGWIEVSNGVDGPSKIILQLKQFTQLGAYELSTEPHTKGLHEVHVELHGEPISLSPFRFFVIPGVAVGSKSRLTQVSDPAIVNETCELLLQAVDKYGNTLDSGGATIAARALGTSVSPCTVVDNNDGTYTVQFTSTVEGESRVIVRLDNTEMAPVQVTFVEGSGTANAKAKAAKATDTKAPDAKAAESAAEP